MNFTPAASAAKKQIPIISSKRKLDSSFLISHCFTVTYQKTMCNLLATWSDLGNYSEQAIGFFLDLGWFGKLEEGIGIFYIRPDGHPAKGGEFAHQSPEAMEAKTVLR